MEGKTPFTVHGSHSQTCCEFPVKTPKTAHHPVVLINTSKKTNKADKNKNTLQPLITCSHGMGCRTFLDPYLNTPSLNKLNTVCNMQNHINLHTSNNLNQSCY